MNSFVVIALVLVLCGVANAETDTHKETLKKCADEHKVSPEDVVKLNQGDLTLEGDDIKCFTNCFMQKVGLFDKNGEINEKVAKAVLGHEKDPAKTEAAFKKCKSIKGANDCDTAWEIYKCVKSKV